MEIACQKEVAAHARGGKGEHIVRIPENGRRNAVLAVLQTSPASAPYAVKFGNPLGVAEQLHVIDNKPCLAICLLDDLRDFGEMSRRP